MSILSSGTKTGKWFLDHPSGEVYCFYRYNDGHEDGVQIKHGTMYRTDSNCQDVIDGEHHSGGCYHVSVGRSLWNSLISQGFNKIR